MLNEQTMLSLQLLINGTKLIRIEKEDSVVSKFNLYRVIDNREDKLSYGNVIGFITDQYQSFTNDGNLETRQDVRIVGINHRQITTDITFIKSLFITWDDIISSLLDMSEESLNLFTNDIEASYYYVKFETKLGFVGFASPYSDDPTASHSVNLGRVPVPVSYSLTGNVLNVVNRYIQNKNARLPIHSDYIVSVDPIKVNVK